MRYISPFLHQPPMYVVRASYGLVLATVGVGTVLIWDFSVAITVGGGVRIGRVGARDISVSNCFTTTTTMVGNCSGSTTECPEEYVGNSSKMGATLGIGNASTTTRSENRLRENAAPAFFPLQGRGGLLNSCAALSFRTCVQEIASSHYKISVPLSHLPVSHCPPYHVCVFFSSHMRVPCCWEDAESPGVG